MKTKKKQKFQGQIIMYGDYNSNKRLVEMQNDTGTLDYSLAV